MKKSKKIESMRLFAESDIVSRAPCPADDPRIINLGGNSMSLGRRRNSTRLIANEIPFRKLLPRELLYSRAVIYLISPPQKK